MDTPFRKTFTRASLLFNEECFATCIREFSQVRDIVFTDDDSGEYRVCEITYEDDPTALNDTLLYAINTALEETFDTRAEDVQYYKLSKNTRMVRFFYTIEKAPNF